MTADRDPRDRQVAAVLGYSLYHYNDQHSYYQLWGADGNPVWDHAAPCPRNAFPEFATEVEAWALCPRFTESEDACREVRRFVYRQGDARRYHFVRVLIGRRLDHEKLGEMPPEFIAEECLLRLQPSDIVDAFLACHAAEPWVDVRDIGFGDFDTN